MLRLCLQQLHIDLSYSRKVSIAAFWYIKAKIHSGGGSSSDQMTSFQNAQGQINLFLLSLLWQTLIFLYKAVSCANFLQFSQTGKSDSESESTSSENLSGRIANSIISWRKKQKHPSVKENFLHRTLTAKYNNLLSSHSRFFFQFKKEITKSKTL